MKKTVIFITILIFFSACNLKKVEKHHGVYALDQKQKKLKLNKSNKNDILLILGSPSTKSNFDEDMWFYIERKKGNLSLKDFAKEKVIANNVLIIEFNNRGILTNKEFLNIEKMNNLAFSNKITESNYKTNTFIYDFLSSMRQKINDPLGKRKRK
tara:strand:- start:71 stop:535 length:465 start_codon:yes stop_codon:yes gene_type:complete